MQIDARFMAELPSGSLMRTVSAFDTLNARIARLAMCLGVALEREDHLHSVFKSPEEFVDPLRKRYCIELRGLLVLRYRMMRNATEKIGVGKLRVILTSVEQQLALDGFKPASDGLLIEKIFSKD